MTLVCKMDYDTIIEMIESRKGLLSKNAFYWWTVGTIHAFRLSGVITTEEKEVIRKQYLDELED